MKAKVNLPHVYKCVNKGKIVENMQSMMVMHLMLMICFSQETNPNNECPWNQLAEKRIIYDNAAKIVKSPAG
jgi:hypothetical protein